MEFLEVFQITTLDIVVITIVIYCLYKLFFKTYFTEKLDPPVFIPPSLPPLKKQDMTVEQLMRFDGEQEKHICLALLGKIYDVTKGKNFYGLSGPYGILAGRDATRALGTMNLKLVKTEYDDLSDLTESDLYDAEEWAQRLGVKYPVVGKLLKPGESPENYEEESESFVINEESSKEK